MNSNSVMVISGVPYNEVQYNKFRREIMATYHKIPAWFPRQFFPTHRIENGKLVKMKIS